MYGCSKDNSKREQIFPAIMRTNCNTFAFKDCCFLIQKDREGASRVIMKLFIDSSLEITQYCELLYTLGIILWSRCRKIRIQTFQFG